MFKKTFFAALLTGASLVSYAATYYAVVPVKGRMAAAPTIQVSLSPAGLPEGIVGLPYAGFDLKNALQVTGDAAYTGAGVTWSVVANTLPTGLTLKADGTLSGTPTSAGTGTITARATYKGVNGQQTYQIVTIEINVGLATATLPVATQGTLYNSTGYDFKPRLSVTGDANYTVGQATFRLANGSTALPTGLSITSDGMLVGTPTATTAGTSFTLEAAYKLKTGQQAYTIVVGAAMFDVTSIAASSGHLCAVTTAGAAVCWGNNSNGQLGDDTTVTRWTPAPVSGLTSGVTSVTVGNYHTCAVVNGAAKCWGFNSQGQLGNGSKTSAQVPGQVTGLTSGVTKIAAGDNYVCAVVANALKCWGRNANYQLGDGTNVERDSPTQVTGLTSGVASVDAGLATTCAVTTSGAAKCWGYNGYGMVGSGGPATELNPVSPVGMTSGVSRISIGTYSTCAVTTSGAVKCWGFNMSGQLGDGTTTNRTTPVAVSGLSTGASDISVKMSHACALMANGTIKCWGLNSSGELGDGTLVNRLTSVTVVGLPGAAVSVSTASGLTCAATVTGGRCWGGRYTAAPTAP